MDNEPQLVKQDENKLPPNPEGRGGFGDRPEDINREGRPKKGWAWSELLETIGEEIAPVEGNTDKTFKEFVGRRLWLECIAGNVHAIKELFNRMEGLPRMRMEIEGKVDTGSDKVAELLQLMYAKLHAGDGAGDNKENGSGVL